jgi:uncharacterized protein
MMPVRLRGHHFLCVLTYRGKGYSDAFVENMSTKVAAIRSGHLVQLIIGPDDICNGLTEKCLRDVQHDCRAADTLRLDSLAVETVSRVLNRDLGQPAPLTPAEIKTLRSEFASGTIRAACRNCSWKEFCDQIAAEQFSGTLL